MKRILHALAVLWPWEKISIRTGLAPCESADSRICKAAKGQPSESAHLRISASAFYTLKITTVFIGQRPLRAKANQRFSASANLPMAFALATILFMCLTAAKQVSAQQAEPADAAMVEPLQIGDMIPEELWHLPLQVVNHPEGKEMITLNDYRGNRLIILEFWGFSCSGCIRSISKLDTIKKAFGEQMALLPVHLLPYSFDETRMLQYVGNVIKRNEWSVPSVVRDTVLYTLFTRYLPDWGDVWILDGRLLAVPQHGYINHETIASVLNGQFIDFNNRRNMPPINPYRPLLAEGNGEGEELQSTEHSIITGYIPHQYAKRFKFEQQGDSTFIYTWNRPLPELLYEAYKPDIMEHLTMDAGIKWEAKCIDRELFWKVDTTLGPIERVRAREAWNTENLYSYQLRIPGKFTEDEARYIMQRDLTQLAETHWAIHLSVDTLNEHRYAILKNLGSKEDTQRLIGVDIDTIYTNHDTDTYRFVGYGMETFILNINKALRDNQKLQLSIGRVVDSTEIPGEFKSRFEFPKSFRDGTVDISTVQETLKKHGLRISLKQNKVPVLLVRSIAQREETSSSHTPIH